VIERELTEIKMRRLKIKEGQGSKKCGCPFLLKGKELSNTTGWVLMIVCNHYRAENLEGHSFICRLSEEEEKLVINLSKTLVRPRDILNTL